MEIYVPSIIDINLITDINISPIRINQNISYPIEINKQTDTFNPSKFEVPHA